MPWWSWLIIWAGLVLLLLGMFAVTAFVLFRKGVAVLDALDALGRKMDLLDAAEEVVEQQRTELAILAGVRLTRERREHVRAAARDRRAARHDARIARAKALTKVDASTREWFKAD